MGVNLTRLDELMEENCRRGHGNGRCRAKGGCQGVRFLLLIAVEILSDGSI